MIVPAMQKRHFVAIAAALLAAKPPRLCSEADDNGARRAQWETCVSELASCCASSNGQFDRSRFLAACGVDA